MYVAHAYTLISHDVYAPTVEMHMRIMWAAPVNEVMVTSNDSDRRLDSTAQTIRAALSLAIQRLHHPPLYS